MEEEQRRGAKRQLIALMQAGHPGKKQRQWQACRSVDQEPIVQGPKTVCVELRPFNDRQYNHDLVLLCERASNAAPQLPDGRRLLFRK